MIKANVKDKNTVKAMKAFARIILNEDCLSKNKTAVQIGAALFLEETKEFKDKEDAYTAFICQYEDGKFIINSLVSIAKGDFNEVGLEDFSCKLLAAIRTAEAAKEFGLI